MKESKIKLTANIVLILITICIVSSCKSQIKIVEYIDKGSPLTLNVNTIDKSTGFTSTKKSEILPTSPRYKKFLDWCTDNDKGWTSSPASFNAKVGITQGNFHFVLLNNGIAIGFTDRDGKPRQFSKTTDTTSLDFLTEE